MQQWLPGDIAMVARRYYNGCPATSRRTSLLLPLSTSNVAVVVRATTACQQAVLTRVNKRGTALTVYRVLQVKELQDAKKRLSHKDKKNEDSLKQIPLLLEQCKQAPCRDHSCNSVAKCACYASVRYNYTGNVHARAHTLAEVHTCTGRRHYISTSVLQKWSLLCQVASQTKMR